MPLFQAAIHHNSAVMTRFQPTMVIAVAICVFLPLNRVISRFAVPGAWLILVRKKNDTKTISHETNAINSSHPAVFFLLPETATNKRYAKKK